MEGGNGRGIKDVEDVIACLEDGDSALDLYEQYGERIAQLLAAALDHRMHRTVCRYCARDVPNA